MNFVCLLSIYIGNDGLLNILTTLCIHLFYFYRLEFSKCNIACELCIFAMHIMFFFIWFDAIIFKFRRYGVIEQFAFSCIGIWHWNQNGSIEFTPAMHCTCMCVNFQCFENKKGETSKTDLHLISTYLDYFGLISCDYGFSKPDYFVQDDNMTWNIRIVVISSTRGSSTELESIHIGYKTWVNIKYR